MLFKVNISKVKKVLVVVLILILALGLRLYKLDERTLFDADQEWLANQSFELIKGDIPLLGPVTSVGSFSIGPGRGLLGVGLVPGGPRRQVLCGRRLGLSRSRPCHK